MFHLVRGCGFYSAGRHRSITLFSRCFALLKHPRKVGGRSEVDAILPLMMLSSPSRPEQRHLYELASGDQIKPKVVINLPEIAGCHCIGSSQGYIFTINCPPLEMLAINPLTGHTLPLPSIDLLPPAVYGEKYDSLFLLGKAILSPSLDTLFLFRFSSLSVARVGEPNWTAHRYSLRECTHDSVFYKGRLYAVGLMGDFVTFDPTNPTEPPIYVDDHLPLQTEPDLRIKNYLVTSPDGQDLFLLSRRRMDPADYKYYPPMTNFFNVFKLLDDDDGKCRWETVTDLGGLAMFIGINHSVSYYAGDFAPLLKPNRIYFTDNYLNFELQPSTIIGDSGIFSLHDKSTEIYVLSRDDVVFDWPPPVWLVPRVE